MKKPKPGKFSFLVSSFFLFALTTLGQSQTNTFWEDSSRILLLGIERLAQSDFREAIPILEAAISKDPRNPTARAWLAYAFHSQRRLDEAAKQYRELLRLQPTQPVDARRREAVLRFVPRVFQVASDPFPLRDSIAIHHPDEPLIAYHFFWQDDIDFPSDNDPCDHELVWIRYDPRSLGITHFYTYFHGRILESAAAVSDAHEYGERVRVNVQWGKHGSLPEGWKDLSIQANLGDIEKKYLDLAKPETLGEYNRATYMKLHNEGREEASHPRTASWPIRFEGSWEDFTRFDKEVDLRPFYEKGGMIALARWSSAVIQQRFLDYNFRPKTEWPDRFGHSDNTSLQLEARVGATGEQIMKKSESVALRAAAGITAGSFLMDLKTPASSTGPALPEMSLFAPETPRFPNLWLKAPAGRFRSYAEFIRFIEQTFLSRGFAAAEVTPNEGADLVFSIEHLQPWIPAPGLGHAHALHVRFFWKKLESAHLERVEEPSGPFWQVAASVHYEVEHANFLHADVEVCPYCGRTGGYAAETGNLVERVHDPVGLELLLRGTVHRRAVMTSSGAIFPSLRELLRIRDSDVLVTAPTRGDMNTAAIAILHLTP